jgi:hypothetical protein
MIDVSPHFLVPPGDAYRVGSLSLGPVQVMTKLSDPMSRQAEEYSKDSLQLTYTHARWQFW